VVLTHGVQIVCVLDVNTYSPVGGVVGLVPFAAALVPVAIAYKDAYV
jgi:hypothetical protein